MGMQESKFDESFDAKTEDLKNDDKVDFNIGKILSEPILTPAILLDPRSPSANIARTPVEVALKREFTSETPNNASPLYILGDDPRSPAVDFTRTPIVLNAQEQKSTIGNKPYNKNLDNVRKTLINTETKAKLSPKLLESSPIAFSPNSYKRKSMAGVLETNIDFTETDLDNVQKIKQDLNKTLPDKITLDCMTPISNQIKKQMENLGLEPTENEPNIIEHIEEELANEELKVPETINITAQVKKFDKKLSTLIYEDDAIDQAKTDNKIPRPKSGSRTPLGTRNMNAKEVKKSASKLKVNDKPRKSDGFSRIPVLKKGIQCENTPPHLLEERKFRSKASKWDNDKTLVI